MSRIFINREKELEFLESRYKSNKKELIIIYGRRRVGKTELLKQFIRNKDAIYFLSDKRGTLLNAKRLMEIVSEYFNYPYFEPKNFDDVFKLISKLAKKRLVVIIDEFSYLIEQDNTLPSVFQYIVDEILSDNIMLILCGSLVGTMESLFSYKNPLYGRRTGQWKVEPLDFFDFAKRFKEWSLEEQIKLFAITGGVPFYFMMMDEKITVLENIRKNILNKGSVLYDEVEFLLREELRDISTYLAILEAIAMGKTRVSDIANYTKVRVNDLPKYLKVLMKLGLIEREIPITESWKKTKKSIYWIKDNFFRFWFRFVLPNKSRIEAGDIDYVLESKIEPYFNDFVGFTFEQIARTYILRKFNVFEIDLLGRYWGKIRRKNEKTEAIEIDIIAINRHSKDIAFFEVKWSELSTIDTKKILNDLIEKSKYVPWEVSSRKEYFGVIGKYIENKDTFRKQGYFIYDLDDFSRLFLNQKRN